MDEGVVMNDLYEREAEEFCEACNAKHEVAINNRAVICTNCHRTIRIIAQTRRGPVINRTDF